ncbi:hypothetical protein TNCV_3631761 [Trichonephila clavipes]|nr:hypothetical protein TNCV_3631761 [Trichonephila clavipes]
MDVDDVVTDRFNDEGSRATQGKLRAGKVWPRRKALQWSNCGVRIAEVIPEETIKVQSESSVPVHLAAQREPLKDKPRLEGPVLLYLAVQWDPPKDKPCLEGQVLTHFDVELKSMKDKRCPEGPVPTYFEANRESPKDKRYQEEQVPT